MQASRGGVRSRRVDADGLVRWAHAHGAELVLPASPWATSCHVGGELVRVLGDDVDAGRSESSREMVALGDERTFARILRSRCGSWCDIANRALSPAVNDPTTAVQVIDHIGEVLTVIGQHGSRERATANATGAPQLPWSSLDGASSEDFVTLGLTEIREYGASSVQVVRRLRALLDELLETVRPEHRAAIVAERRRLDRDHRPDLGRLDRPRSRERTRSAGDRRPTAARPDPLNGTTND